MKLLRALQNAYEQVTNTKLNNLAKGAWLAVASVLFSLLRATDWSMPEWQFIGQGFKAEAGAGSTVTLSAGMALWHDAAEGDDFTGQLKPVFNGAELELDMATNSDASGDDRIDLIAVKPVLEAENEQTVKRKNPATGDIGDDDLNQQKRWTFEWQVVEGAPAAAPVAPATPAGFVAVAEVLRTNGDAGVAASDITDKRELAGLAMGFVHAAAMTLTGGGVLTISDGGTIELEGTGGGAVELTEEDGRLAVRDEAGELVQLFANGATIASAWVTNDSVAADTNMLLSQRQAFPNDDGTWNLYELEITGDWSGFDGQFIPQVTLAQSSVATETTDLYVIMDWSNGDVTPYVQVYIKKSDDNPSFQDFYVSVLATKPN